MDPVKKF